MPTYDYRCGACEHRFEHYQSMSEALLRKCPACGRAKLERLIGAGAGILFKGSGFYQTDYKSGAPPKPAGESQPAAVGSDAKGAPAAPVPPASTPAPAPTEAPRGRPPRRGN